MRRWIGFFSDACGTSRLKYHGGELSTIPSVSSSSDCQYNCERTANCDFWAHHSRKQICEMYGAGAEKIYDADRNWYAAEKTEC